MIGFQRFKGSRHGNCCSNAVGTHRCKLLVIRKSLHPRDFKGMTQLPVNYRANKKDGLQLNLHWISLKMVLFLKLRLNVTQLD